MRLGLLLLLFTILHVPLFIYYSSWTGLTKTKVGGNDSIYTIGNMGQANTKCESASLAAKHMLIGCQTGKITDITHFGIY